MAAILRGAHKSALLRMSIYLGTHPEEPSQDGVSKDGHTP
jgi:hypothetical protein